MKKFITLLLTTFLTFTLFAATCSEYRVKLTDKIEVGTSETFECVATIAHLAEFQEYSYPEFDYSAYDEYFSKYLTNTDVYFAIMEFKTLRKIGFGFDAVASLATYLTPDCQNYRTDIKTVSEKLDQRCKNPERLLKLVSAFYNATDFDTFYQSQIPEYKKYTQLYIDNKDLLLEGISKFENYYHSSINNIFISLSIINGYGNFGLSFDDGTNQYFEPKYGANYFDPNIIIHELSHPISNQLAEKMFNNKKIMKYFQDQLIGEKAEQLKRIGYIDVNTYLYELINRANTNSILREFMSEDFCKLSIISEKLMNFDEIQEVTDIFELYKNGNYKDIMEFSNTFEKELLKVTKNRKKIPVKKDFSPENTETITLFDKSYKAKYCGSKEVPFSGKYVPAKFWLLENSYDDIKHLTGNGISNLMPNIFFPCDVELHQVYKIEILQESGILTLYYCNVDNKMFETENASDLIWMD